VYKFGVIRFSDVAVYDVRMCTAGVVYFTGVSSVTFARGALLGTAAISNQVCFITIRGATLLLCRAGYTLGSATHF